MKFIELEGFGPNMLTVAFFATIILSLAQAYGLGSQVGLIKETGSIKSVSIPCFIYFTIHFICFGLYGLKHERLAFVISGTLLALMYSRVVDTAIDYGAKTNVYALIVMMVAVVGGSMMSPLWLDHWVIGTLYCIGTVFVILIPIEMLRAGGRGSVSVTWLATVGGSVLFWLIYGMIVGDRMLIANCSVSILALIWAGYLYIADVASGISADT